MNTNIDRPVRVRFAPSPTGPLHIGGVRTALYNYLFARQMGGSLILRIEDTDSSRFVPGAEAYIIEALNWLGIQFDEGVSFGGAYGPYRQSERRHIYREYVDQLLRAGRAYYAFDTPEELEAKRTEISNFQYDATTRNGMRNSLTMSTEEVQWLISSGEQYVVRFLIEPDIDVEVYDLIRGRVVINSSVLDDKVLYKSVDDLPTYHLANIVDDHLMEISHVIRGEEWLPSAPLHVLLYHAFDWVDTMPQFAHLSLLLKPDGNGKLSKRDGDRLGFPVFPLDWIDPQTGDRSSGYREAGYLPEAVVNFLALLGWSPGNDKEMFSMQDLITAFRLSHCSKSGARFDYEKGKWFNREYLQLLPTEHLSKMLAIIVENHHIKADIPKLRQVVSLVRDRATFVSDLWEQGEYFFVAPSAYDEKTVKKRWKGDSAIRLTELANLLTSTTDFSALTTESIVKNWIAAHDYHLGNIMNALRLALVGEGKGVDIFNITEVIGLQETIARLHKAIEVLG